MKKWQKALLQLIASVSIIGASVYGYDRMTAARKAPEREEVVRAAPLVSAVEVSVQSMQMTVQGNGTVQALKEVQVVPQVAGKIVRRHEHLVNGGFFRAREPLVTSSWSSASFASWLTGALRPPLFFSTKRAPGRTAKTWNCTLLLDPQLPWSVPPLSKPPRALKRV